jgi:hypothetical protein
MRMIGLILVCFIIGLSSCNHKNTLPDGILKKDQMQAVLWDIFKAEVFTSQFIKKDTLKNPIIENAKLQNQIFAIHHISREDFYKSYNYYKEHTDLLQAVLDSMSNKSTSIRNRLLKAKTKKDSALLNN